MDPAPTGKILPEHSVDPARHPTLTAGRQHGRRRDNERGEQEKVAVERGGEQEEVAVVVVKAPNPTAPFAARR